MANNSLTDARPSPKIQAPLGRVWAKSLTAREMANAIFRSPSRIWPALFVAFFAFTAGILATPNANAATVAKAPDAPTIVSPEWGEVEGESKPEFRGLVQHGMQVEIHVDGQFNGLARVADGGTKTDSFAGRPSLGLKPGLHSAVFRAKDPDTGLRSPKSDVLSFWVRPQVAPALTETVVDSRTTINRPFVVGLSTSNTNVKVYVDGVYDGMIGVGEHPSNAVHFAYEVEKPMKIGTHTITAIAVSVDGRTSVMSKGLTYTIQPAVATVATRPTISPKSSSTSSEDADSDDTSEPKVSGESDVVKDSEQEGDVSVTPDDEVTDDETTVEVTTEDEDADRADKKAEDETDNTALVTWIIVIIVLVIILALRLRSGAGAESPDGSATGLAGGDGKSPEGSGKSTDNKNKNGKVPPPPPPSSSY